MKTLSFGTFVKQEPRSVPPMTLTFETILQTINEVDRNEFMGAGKLSKEDHLAERLFALFNISKKSKGNPVTITPLLSNAAAEEVVEVQTDDKEKPKLVRLTYDRIIEAIRHVKTNDLMGAGKFSKKEHLAEHLYAIFNLAMAEEPNAVTRPAGLGAKAASVMTGVRAPERPAVAASVGSGPTPPPTATTIGKPADDRPVEKPPVGSTPDPSATPAFA